MIRSVSIGVAGRAVFFCALLGLAPSLAAQEFHASTSDWALGGLRFVQFSDDGVIHLAGKADKTIPAGDLVALRREKTRLPEHPTPPFLLLTSGERIPLERGEVPVWKDNRLDALTRGASAGKKGSLISVPLAYLALVCLDHPHADEDSEIVIERLLMNKRKSDMILLTNGDQIEGKVLEREPKSWRIQAGEREVDLDVDRIALLAANPDRLIAPRAKKTFFRATTLDGARLDFITLALDPERRTLAGKSLYGASFEFPLTMLAALEARQGRAVFLSDLLPSKIHTGPILGVNWPLGRDRTPLGRPLRLVDGTYDKGLSMTPGSSAQYDLKGAYRWFEARVGLDARDGRLGKATAWALVDGKKMALGVDQELSLSGDPLEVRLDVSGAQTLTLAIHSGSRVGVQAIVNWGNARLVK